MIYCWKVPENVLNKEMGVYDETCSPDHFLLRASRKLDLKEFSPMPVVHFKIPQNRALKFDCLVNSAGIPLVNERIQDILEEIAPNEVQFFPAKVICSDGELAGYTFLNVTVEIEGIDHEKTVYDQSGYGFHYLTYKKGCLGEHPLTRDKEYHSNLLVSEKLKIIFDQAKITGVWLVRPEEYYRPLG
ncbi:MAG: hypothetical protein LEGION0403_FIIPPAGN_02868 [Legionella sp.]|uniref:imm11 family protein n=1 Tax=Legionella sp. TaxID=459 RepID=UPI003D0CD736